jgi:hypothetical protein
MEEQLLFTRIHDALDIPVPPGAYERLRTQLTKKPVRPFRWPALQTRWSKMSFRFAAGLAIVAIAVAAAAAAVAIHNSTNNTSPAGPRMSIQAYQHMIFADSPNPNTIWTDQCDETNPTAGGCQADAARSIPVIQKWVDDLKAASTPTRFAIIDAELRNHLTQNLAALSQLETDAAAGNRAAMAADYVIAVYAADWTGTVVPLITQSQQVSASGYKNIVAMQKHGLDLCIASCPLLVSNQAKSCVTNGGIPCLQMFDEVAVNYAMSSGMLVRDAAPDSLAAGDAKLQGDLESADAVLLQTRLAVGHGDQAGINSGITQLLRITARIDLDAAAITG